MAGIERITRSSKRSDRTPKSVWAALTNTFVPVGQYDAGRHCTSVPEIQRQAPSTFFGVEVTVSALTAAALLVTGVAKVTTTGMPTPTVQSSPGTSVVRL